MSKDVSLSEESRKEIRMRFIWKVSIVLFGLCLLSTYGQDKMRMIEKHEYLNAPIEVVGLQVGEKPFNEDNIVLADERWLKELRFSVKNRSDSNITAFDIALLIDKRGAMTTEVSFPVLFPASSDSYSENAGDVHRKATAEILRPGEIVKVRISDSHFRIFDNILKQSGAEDIQKVRLYIQHVDFEDGTRWSFGQTLKASLRNRSKGESKHETCKSTDHPGRNRQDDNFLVVDFAVSKEIVNVAPLRQERNSKFDSWKWVREYVSPESTSVTLYNDWEVGMPAFPVRKSDAVVIGVVRSGQAFLSNTRTGIYSEFSIEVKDWLKRVGGQSNFTNEIIAQRPGGRILYPDGTIVGYSVSGQEMPQLDRSYLFFLSDDPQRGTFNIKTAYEIADGKIRALDGRGKSKSSGYKFTKYDGIGENHLLQKLRKAIASGTEVSLGARIQ
ncbi:MAG: hypothetical protein AB7J13_12135 [Pyrinomonadaceae bacterium]